MKGVSLNGIAVAEENGVPFWWFLAYLPELFSGNQCGGGERVQGAMEGYFCLASNSSKLRKSDSNSTKKFGHWAP